MVIVKQEECSRISKTGTISCYLAWTFRCNFSLSEDLNTYVIVLFFQEYGAIL